MVAQKQPGFELSVSARDDGTLEAIYIRLSANKIARTEEVPGKAEIFADYDRHGDLVGLEVLSPVKLSTLTRLVQPPRRVPFRRFVREAAPETLVHA